MRTIALLEARSIGINVVSYGLHSQKQCIIIPSVGGSSSKQGYCFFICLLGVFDCVCGKVDARSSVQFAVLQFAENRIIKRFGIRFFANAISGDFVANEKMILLLAF